MLKYLEKDIIQFIHIEAWISPCVNHSHLFKTFLILLPRLGAIFAKEAHNKHVKIE